MLDPLHQEEIRQRGTPQEGKVGWRQWDKPQERRQGRLSLSAQQLWLFELMHTA